MRATTRILFALLAALPAGHAIGGQVPATPPDARQLVAAVLANQRSSGFTARAKVESRVAAGPARAVQVLVKGRRAGNTSTTLVAAMWPAEVKGHALVLDRRDGGEATGFRFTPPDKVERIDRAGLDDPLFGTGLCADDLTESFWEWPDPRVTGPGKQGNADCWIVESRPRGARSRHGLVRSWIDPRKNAPAMIEKFGNDGKLTTRVTIERWAKRDDGGWSPAAMRIESPATSGVTTVSFSRGERGLALPASDFTPAAVKALSAGK